MRHRFRGYVSDDAEACAALYNTVFQVVPTFVPVDAETVHRSVNEPESVHTEVAEPGIVVATRDDNSLAGFVAFCRRRTAEAEPWHGLIRLLCCPLDDPSLATDLVAATRAALLESGVNELQFDGSGGVRFLNGGAVGLPESLAAVTAALVRGGLKLTNRELMYAGPTAALPEKPRNSTVSVTLSPVGTEQCSCQAFVGDELVGECWAMLHRDVNSHPVARQVAYLQWIGVCDQLRGQGIGNQMLEYTLGRLRDVGVDQLQLGTSHDNVDAQAFYQLAGLRVVDQLLSFRSHPAGAPKTALSS